MTNKVLLISESYLKQYTQLQGNISNDALTSSILKAQTRYILPVLGLNLYNKIINDIYNAGSINGLTGNYRVLLDDYIVYTLTEWSLYETTFNLSFKMQNKGIGRMNDQYQESVDLETLKYIRNEIRNNAQWYQERLIQYLCDNNNLFPEYNTPSDDLNPDSQTGSFNSGIYFKGKHRRNVSNPFNRIKGIDYDFYEF